MKFTAFELNAIYNVLTGNDIYETQVTEKISNKIRDFLEAIDFNVELNLFEEQDENRVEKTKNVLNYDPQRG